MTQSPMPPGTTQGHATPTVTQFGVFLDNRVGKLYDLVEAFDGQQCQICALTVNEASDYAVVRIIATKARLAEEILKRQGLQCSKRDLLVVELSPGHTLASLCLCLLRAELSIHFAYPLMLRPNGSPTIAIAVDDLTLAGQILRRKEFRLFGEAELAGT